LIKETLYNHPVPDKIKGVIEYLEVRPGLYKERTLFFKDDNGIDSISWVQCIKHGLGLKISNMNRIDITTAFRQAIDPDTQKYRRINTNDICTSCQETNHIQVDHVDPFSNILSDFLKQQSVNMESVKINKIHYNITLLDTHLHDEWVEYHNTRAKYQLLCRKCNVRKSNNI
jgi:hypothetical protein